jgi:hypothetical protein
MTFKGECKSPDGRLETRPTGAADEKSALRQFDGLLLHDDIRHIPAFLIHQLLEGAAEEQGDTHKDLQGL